MNSNLSEINKKNKSDLNETIIQLESVSCNLSIGFMMIGIVDNLISIVVFSNKKLNKCKFNWYLISLSIFETIFCTTVIIDYIHAGIDIEKVFLHELNKISFLIIYFIIHTSDSCVTMLTLLLSLDRLYAIKFPLKIKQFVTNLHAKKLILISITVVILLKKFSFIFCELNIGTNSQLVYCAVISPLIFNFIPLIIILILNIWLVFEIVTPSKNNQLVKSAIRLNTFLEDNKSITQNENSIISEIQPINLRKFTMKPHKLSGKQKSHYIIILVSSLWSILTTIPYYSVNPYFSLSNFHFFSKFDSNSIFITQIISSVLFNFNHCINFFIYISFYSDFRVVLTSFFYKIFLRKVPKKSAIAI